MPKATQKTTTSAQPSVASPQIVAETHGPASRKRTLKAKGSKKAK